MSLDSPLPVLHGEGSGGGALRGAPRNLGEAAAPHGPEIAAHFHGPAAAGVNAPIMVPVDAKESPFKGSATLTDVQAKAFADGMVYFNIHTAEHKPGEIRGQMMMEK